MSIMQDNEVPELLFMGCERGLFVSIDYGKNWTRWKHGLPAVPVSDIKIQERESDLILSTFGNGIFIIDDIRALRNLAANPSHFEKKLTISQIPVAYQWRLKRPLGGRFNADADYAGENRPTGARIGIHVNFEKNSIPEKKENDNKKLNLFILNEKRDTIRHLELIPDTGFNFMYWNFESDGHHFPSRKLTKKKKDFAGNGAKARPGRYIAIVSYDSHKDSAYFEVREDPRIDMTDDRYTQCDIQRAKIDSLIQRASSYTDALITIQEAIQLAEQRISMLNDTTFGKVSLLGDSIKKEVTEIFGLFFLPEDTRGIIDDSQTIHSLLYTAMSSNSRDDISENNAHTYTHAAEALDRAKRKINELMTGKWTKWNAAVQARNLNLIPEVRNVD